MSARTKQGLQARRDNGKPSVAPSEREVSLEFRASACPPIRKTFPLSKFARDKYGYLLDTGKTEIKCANEK